MVATPLSKGSETGGFFNLFFITYPIGEKEQACLLPDVLAYRAHQRKGNSFNGDGEYLYWV
jgi:hypothetical protein